MKIDLDLKSYEAVIPEPWKIAAPTQWGHIKSDLNSESYGAVDPKPWNVTVVSLNQKVYV